MKPPTKAPAMPIKTVTMMPPGSGPGMIHFARAPAMSPTTINAKMPIRSHLPLVLIRAGRTVNAPKYRLMPCTALPPALPTLAPLPINTRDRLWGLPFGRQERAFWRTGQIKASAKSAAVT